MTPQCVEFLQKLSQSAGGFIDGAALRQMACKVLSGLPCQQGVESLVLEGQTPIKRGQIWVHDKGQEYRVVEFTNLHSSDQTRYPGTVVYQGLDNGRLWSRPAHDWHRSMKLKE